MNKSTEELRYKIANTLQDDFDHGLIGVGTTDQILKLLKDMGYVRLIKKYRAKGSLDYETWEEIDIE